MPVEIDQQRCHALPQQCIGQSPREVGFVASGAVQYRHCRLRAGSRHDVQRWHKCFRHRDTDARNRAITMDAWLKRRHRVERPPPYTGNDGVHNERRERCQRQRRQPLPPRRVAWVERQRCDGKYRTQCRVPPTQAAPSAQIGEKLVDDQRQQQCT
jgi:hypothetical protein